MSFKSCLIKCTYSVTPKKMVYWLVNSNLKGIAKLRYYDVNFDEKKIHSSIHLEGEEGEIDVCLEDFSLMKKGDEYRFIVRQAQSNRPWLNTALNRFLSGQEIPIPPEQVPLVQDLFALKAPDSEPGQE